MQIEERRGGFVRGASPIVEWARSADCLEEDGIWMAQTVGSTENERTCREHRSPRKASCLQERIWTISPDRLILSRRETPVGAKS